MPLILRGYQVVFFCYFPYTFYCRINQGILIDLYIYIYIYIYICFQNSLRVHQESTKGNLDQVGSYICDKDIRDFICEKVDFFQLGRHKFPNFLRELAY